MYTIQTNTNSRASRRAIKACPVCTQYHLKEHKSEQDSNSISHDPELSKKLTSTLHQLSLVNSELEKLKSADKGESQGHSVISELKASLDKANSDILNYKDVIMALQDEMRAQEYNHTQDKKEWAGLLHSYKSRCEEIEPLRALLKEKKFSISDVVSYIKSSKLPIPTPKTPKKKAK